VDFEIELLVFVREMLDEHEAECEQRPKAILLNPANHALLGWDEFLGLPVLPDPRVAPMKANLLCGDRGWGGFFEGEPVWWKPDGSTYRLIEPEEQS
jgi:hypothetical protein